MPSTKASASKVSRSSRPSPTPTSFTGTPYSSWRRHHDPPAGARVHLRQHDPGDVHRLPERLQLSDGVLPDRGVQDQERLVRGALDPAAHHAVDLAQLLHEAPVRVQPARRVDEEDVGAPRLRRLDGVEGDRRGVSALLAAHEGGAHPLGPYAELLDRARAERVGRRHHDAPTLVAQVMGELGDRGGLPHPVHAHDQVDGRRRVRGGQPGVDAGREDVPDLRAQRVPQPLATPGLPAARGVLHPVHQAQRRGHAEVGGQQPLLQRLQRLVVHPPGQDADVGERQVHDPLPETLLPFRCFLEETRHGSARLEFEGRRGHRGRGSPDPGIPDPTAARPGVVRSTRRTAGPG